MARFRAKTKRVSIPIVGMSTTVGLIVPEKWRELHKNTDVSQFIDSLFHGLFPDGAYGGIQAERSHYGLLWSKRLEKALKNAVKLGYGIVIHKGNYHIYVGPFAGSWYQLPNNKVSWYIPPGYEARVDPWAWHTAKTETKKHLTRTLGVLKDSLSSSLGTEMRFRAFIRTWLTRGATQAVRLLFPLMHPATRRTFIKATGGDKYLGKLTFHSIKKLRHQHLNYDYLAVASTRLDKEELVSRFGWGALQEHTHFIYELDRIADLPQDRLPPGVLEKYQARRNRIEPAKLWSKWHREMTDALALSAPQNKEAEEARQKLWDWVLSQPVLSFPDLAKVKVTPLVTMTDLVREHEKMHHCIHTYGDSHNLFGHVTLTKEDGTTEEATFEISQGVIMEHFHAQQVYGPCNARVSSEMQEAMRILVFQLNYWKLSPLLAKSTGTEARSA